MTKALPTVCTLLLLTACDDGIRSVQDMRESSPNVDIKRLDGQITVDIYLPSSSPSTLETPQPRHCPQLDPSVTAEVRGGTLQAFEPGGLGMDGPGCSIPRVRIRDAGREVGITLRDATGSVEISLAPTPELSAVSSTSVARGESVFVRTGATPPPAQSSFHLRGMTAIADADGLTATREPDGRIRLLIPQNLSPVWNGPNRLSVVYPGGASCDGLQCRQVKTSLAFSGVEILP